MFILSDFFLFLWAVILIILTSYWSWQYGPNAARSAQKRQYGSSMASFVSCFFFLNTYGIQTKIINLSLKKHFPHLNSKGHFIDDASTSKRPSKNSTKVCDGICRKSQQLLVFSFSNMPKNFVDLRTVRAITISGYRFRALWLGEIKTKTKQIWPRGAGNKKKLIFFCVAAML